MSEKKPKRKFSREFKREAVRLVLEEGRSVASVCRDLEIHPNQFYQWRKEFLNHDEDSFPGKGYLHTKDEELRKLRRQVADLQEECAILKKAISVFSKPVKRNTGS